jgi:2-oxoglutarate ferredoxin oxidoreductase subunit alpha
MTNSVTWKISGEAGFGIMSAGTMISKAFARNGYHTLATNEYPSLIRGGHNIITVRISSEYFESLNRDVTILVALHNLSVEVHKSELTEGALVVFDPKDKEWTQADFPKPVTLIPVPLAELVVAANGIPVMKNTIALGATVALMGVDFSYIESVIKDQFKTKKQAVIDSNIAIARQGYDYVKFHFPDVTSMHLAPAASSEPKLIINASEALGVGAYRAGLKFAAIYPMTPINSLISFLADHAKELNIVYRQPEDEIAGINMAIGASLAGVRSMVASSGGGFALMVEALSLAGIMELPVVVDLGMRVGPATGMPTWTEQGELQFAIHAGHGEFPKIVLAPSDAGEAYEMIVDAFNLADKYQIPVLVLTDKYMNESQWCVPKSVFTKPVTIDRGKLAKDGELPTDGSFKRYSLDTDNGASLRSIPGQKGGVYISNGYEHDEQGVVTESPHERLQMAGKRLKKLNAIQSDVRPPTLYGEADADITFVSWGSSRGPVIDAIALLKQQGVKANLYHFTWMFPFAGAQVKEMLSKAKRIVDVEQNATGQLAALIREHTGVEITEKILKFDGRPFFPEDIVEAVRRNV